MGHSEAHRIANMELYKTSFAALALVNALLACYCRTRSDNTPAEQSLPPSPGRKSKQQVRKFKTTYFGVYVLVVAADWLQVSDPRAEPRLCA